MVKTFKGEVGPVMPWKHMGEWQYTSTYSQPKHKLHTLTTSHHNTIEQAMIVTTTCMSRDPYWHYKYTATRYREKSWNIRLVAIHSQWRFKFNPRPVKVGQVVYKVLMD